MSDSPYIQYATPDIEYAALFASLPPFDFPYDSVEAGRKVIDDMMVPMLKKKLEPELPDGVSSHSIPSTPMIMIIGRCVHSVEVQDDGSLGSRR